MSSLATEELDVHITYTSWHRGWSYSDLRVHTYPRNYSIAEIVKEIKRTSSRWIKEKAPTQKKFSWQHGYGAFSVSQSHLDEVTHYIERQEKHHKRVTFQDEYRAFLKKYCVEYDERYVWD